MGVIWHKVWYDLWHNKLRTLLVILSIAVGVFALGATFGMVEQMLPAMDAAHRSSFPSHGTMYLTQPVARDTILALHNNSRCGERRGVQRCPDPLEKHHEDEWKIGMHPVQRDDYANQTTMS